MKNWIRTAPYTAIGWYFLVAAVAKANQPSNVIKVLRSDGLTMDQAKVAVAILVLAELYVAMTILLGLGVRSGVLTARILLATFMTQLLILFVFDYGRSCGCMGNSMLLGGRSGHLVSIGINLLMLWVLRNGIPTDVREKLPETSTVNLASATVALNKS